MKPMLSFVLVSLLGLVSMSLSYHVLDEDSEKWMEFKSKFSKHYTTQEEDDRKKIVFLENVKKIDMHNEKYKRGEVSHSLIINRYADMREGEMFSGFARKENDNYNTTCELMVEEFLGSDARVPEAIDWRVNGAVTPVKAQGDCGSCWAFSAIGALEGQHFLKTKDLVSLSEQNLIDCDKTDYGCKYGHAWTAFQYIAKHGVDTEESYPYQGVDGTCRFDKSQVGATEKNCRRLPSGDEEALKRAVATVGPISVSIDADKIDFYDKGIFTSSDCSSDPYKANHALVVVGYGSQGGLDYWIVKNSWSDTWGDKGYIYIARNQNNLCGIANYPVFPVV